MDCEDSDQADYQLIWVVLGCASTKQGLVCLAQGYSTAVNPCLVLVQPTALCH